MVSNGQSSRSAGAKTARSAFVSLTYSRGDRVIPFYGTAAEMSSANAGRARERQRCVLAWERAQEWGNPASTVITRAAFRRVAGESPNRLPAPAEGRRPVNGKYHSSSKWLTRKDIRRSPRALRAPRGRLPCRFLQFRYSGKRNHRTQSGALRYATSTGSATRWGFKACPESVTEVD